MITQWMCRFVHVDVYVLNSPFKIDKRVPMIEQD